ncbi:bifunctional homocysteine S-methyltransferase/methylenetetrahydrofolate reductase [Bacillus sp. HMF5848]|uniref:bifunctional homocysteine S-methyltransferase/methylenetetrahydrofolate reductase n=1 Tax=Bacillus sp. HMF5848 TaxID=2495421 RepID=UPI000F796E88|nr:bifunctional homocysteine S-methyltransferase/methylenetetrahydrofolate reductase [Bacillus sp. HMF5848]RSK26417.1 bifunctional homocysteine S-methyltransferase/methylenetetrahydrofolate reductase [Bacillus sp. HMF5848]
MGFLEDLQSRILIGDGAMGTLLYSHGISSCFEERNLTNPDEVQRIHEAYINAGANVIQTNTYGASYHKLARYGLEDKVYAINQTAVQLANAARANHDQDDTAHPLYVLGTIGGLRTLNKNAINIEEIKRCVLQQLNALTSEPLDGILLETYYDWEEITTVLKLIRKQTDLPIVANISLHEPGTLQNGLHVADALDQLTHLGANVVGLNCRLGPYYMIKSFEEVPLPTQPHTYLSVYPNASLPDYKDGQLVYETNEDYFAKSAIQLRAQGARLIGGCCGTTPKHIAALAQALHDLPPIQTKNTKPRRIEIAVVEPIKTQQQPPLHEKAKTSKSIIVELDPPKKLNSTHKFMQGAKALQQAGVDAITLADNSLASPRISNVAMATKLKQELNVNPLVHITCRDRNLIGLQSHIMGLHTLGITEVLAVTGDPSKIGDFPGATSVYDVSSFDLISLIKQFNEGLSYSGKPLGEKTNFSVAAAFNPNVRYLDKAVQRLEKKIECGADYFITQPLYSETQIAQVHEATKHLDTPIYIGIMPLTSSRNAEFIHHEVPGITLSDSIRAQMAAADDAEQEGIAIAKSLIDTAYEYFKGIYLITPFLKYNMTVELTNYIHQKKEASIRG